MSILAAPYVFAGTVSLYLGYKTYNSYYNQPFEYLEIEDLQNENKEKTQEDDIIKDEKDENKEKTQEDDIIKDEKDEKDEELIPFPELINETPPPLPPTHIPPKPNLSPTHKITKPLPNIFVEDKLVKNNEITKLHNPVMETILEEKKPVIANIIRRRRRNKKRKN